MKALHAGWLIYLFNIMTTDQGKNVIIDGWYQRTIKLDLSKLPLLDPFKDISMGDKNINVVTNQSFQERRIQILVIMSWMIMTKSLNGKMKSVLLMFLMKSISTFQKEIEMSNINILSFLIFRKIEFSQNLEKSFLFIPEIAKNLFCQGN